jgi:nitrite reductase/ring-hydroxylating ferredoxin subunit
MVLLLLQPKSGLLKTVSKIGFFLFATALAISAGSCSKAKNDVIPDVHVDFTLDILDPEFVNLAAIGSDTVDGKTNNWGSHAAGGFMGNGIILYNGGDAFYAYDRTCPHDYAINELSVKVKIDFTIATCPTCGTVYSLAASGTPASGVGKYPLKNYRTSFDGRFLRVWNN